MTIEKAPASTANSTSKANANTQAHGAKAKSASADAAADGGATGFGAILGALGDSTADAATPVATAADALQPDAAAASAVPFDASTLLQQNPQIGQQAALAAAAAGKDAAATPGTAVALDAGTQAQTAATALARKAAVPAGAAGADAATPFAAPDVAQQAAESLTQKLQQASAHAKGIKDQAQSASDATASSGTATASQGAELKDTKFLASLAQAQAPQTGRAPEPVFAPLLVKAEKPLSERLTASAKTTESGYSGTALGVSAPDYSQSAAQAAPLTPDMQVAEQVTYWVTHNVQNAEMTLDGLGASPVEVSINVQGNEAQITFRSDEAATRGVLESAGAHLKDLLQREGLVLTGVSVGTSGSGESGAGNERRARQAARQGLIAPLKAATVEPGRRMNTVAGRAVDLFV